MIRIQWFMKRGRFYRSERSICENAPSDMCSKTGREDFFTERVTLSTETEFLEACKRFRRTLAKLDRQRV